MFAVIKVLPDMVEALFPAGEATGLHANDHAAVPSRVDAEAAPEGVVSAAANVRVLGPLFYLRFILDAVGGGFEVVDKVLFAVVHGAADVAGAVRGHRDVAFPAFEAVVLAVFVALPVAFGTEHFLAELGGAAVGACVALEVLAVGMC